jgi:hypothetical protein
MDFWEDAVKEVRVSQWLARHGFPAAQAYDVPQPVEAVGRPVTFWRYIDGRTAFRGDVSSLGRLLRRLHAVPPPTEFRLPSQDILGRVESRIELAPVPRPGTRNSSSGAARNCRARCRASRSR